MTKQSTNDVPTVEQEPLHINPPIASKVNSLAPKKLTDVSDAFRKGDAIGDSLSGAMVRAVDEFESAEMYLAKFKKDNEAVLAEHQGMLEARKLAQRAVYGLMIEAIESGAITATIVDTEAESTDGREVQHDGYWLPQGVSYGVKYEVDYDDAEMETYCAIHNTSLMKPDPKRITRLVKMYEDLAGGKIKMKELPANLPPAVVTEKILPSIAGIGYEPLPEQKQSSSVVYSKLSESGHPLFDVIDKKTKEVLAESVAYADAMRLQYFNK